MIAVAVLQETGFTPLITAAEELRGQQSRLCACFEGSRADSTFNVGFQADCSRFEFALGRNKVTSFP